MCALQNSEKKDDVIFELKMFACLDRTIAVDETWVSSVMITKKTAVAGRYRLFRESKKSVSTNRR